LAPGFDPCVGLHSASREAVADTRRSTATRRARPPPTPSDADLIKLLDTFPAVEAGNVGMDPDRLRAKLGLG
jgi:hypothetical protein